MSAALNQENVSTVNIYRTSPRRMRSFVLDCLYEGLMPCVLGSPGIGKSQIMSNVCDELNLKLIDHRVAGSDPSDFNGLPDIKNGRARFAPFEDVFPIEDTEIPEGKDGWMIFFDEITSAGKAVQAALYKSILDRMTGQHRFHENVVMAAAGNLATDRAITSPISTALQSRMIWFELEIAGHEQEWIEDVALKHGYDSRIVGYLSRYPSKLMDFRPDHDERTFCCPRTWEFMNRLVKDKPVIEEKMPLYAGTITSGVAVDFVQFCQVYANLISLREIISDPAGCRIPHDLSERWATITHVMEKMTEETFEKVTTYANRFPLDFKVLFFRSIPIKQPKLMAHPAYRKALVELSRYLHS